jgi:hypothetical protein
MESPINLSVFRSLQDLPSEVVASEAERIARIIELADTRTAVEIEAERVKRLTPRIIADFLAFMKKSDMRDKYNIGFPTLKRIIDAGTTEEQRKEFFKFDHNRRERERAADIRLKRGTKFTIIPVGKYRSIREAADATGVSEQTARIYYRSGIPPEKWRHVRGEEKQRRGRKDYCKPIGEFKSIRAAARAAGIPPSTARKLIRQGITDPTQWRNLKEVG